MRPGRCHCRGRGGAGDPGEGLQRCLVGAAMSLILGVRCVSPRLGPPLAYIYPVPPRAQGRRRRVRDCRTVPGAGREPAELGEGKQGPRPLPSPRGRAPAARAAAGTFPLPALLPRWTPAQPWRGGCPRPQPAPLALGLRTFHTHLERVSPAPPKNCLICAKPPRPGAEHAAPACRARVHPAQRGGDRAEAVAPGRCLGPDRLHVSPARGHVHRLSPVRRPDVLRINKMKLGETGGQKAPGPPNPHPRPLDLLSAPVSRRSPSALPEPAGQVAALARPRPPAPPPRPRGALPQSLIKKVAKLTLPKVVVACAPLSLPAMYSLKHD